jgi:two-component system nitrate/nitrite response regulator NarL
MQVCAMGNPTAVQANPVVQKVRILIADDHPGIRKAVRFMLQEVPRFEVCGEAVDGAKAIAAAQELKPDVVVLNVTMPVLNGFEAARKINSTLPETAIVILSGNADQRFIAEAKKIGVQAYVPKTRAVEGLVKAIDTAVAGGDFVLLD